MARKNMKRRDVLALGAAGGLALGASGPVSAQARHPQIAIAINQSPWFAGFARLVEAYERETGNRVRLDVNPFAAAAEKQRNSARSQQGIFDILPLNATWMAEVFHGGFLTALTDIDPSFRLDPDILNMDDSCYWDEARKRHSRETGKLYGVTLNPNVPVLYYRRDLYEAKGLTPPKTWDQLLANARALHDAPRIHGMVLRGARSASDVSYDFFPYLHSYGASLFADERAGDFTVAINSPAGKRALDRYLEFRAFAPPNPGSFSNADVIQQVLTGRAAHAMIVIAAWSQMDDPARSAVVGKIDVVVAPGSDSGPSSPTLGHFVGVVPRNVPPERQHAALAFLAWFQKRENQVKYAEAGSPPVSRAVLASDLARDPKNRYMPAVLDSVTTARMMYTVPEGPRIVSVLEQRLNQAVIGEIGSAEALNRISAEVHQIMAGAGYRTGRLGDLR
ncbi:MAG: extracellular solute-binding protein [Tagaea sp.]|nr:extracellular solute-binding protein [Tagaea sp.]